MNREDLKKNPVSGMRGYGTWNQPPGTWSDDTSLTFCLAEDTDTTAAVTGGLAGLMYGYDSIPSEWIHVLARKKDIDDLAERVREMCISG